MIQQVLIGVAAWAMLASPVVLAQSSGGDQETPARPMGSGYGPAYNDRNIITTEPMNTAEVPTGSFNGPVELQLPEAALERLAGTYTTQHKSVIVVTRAGNRLAADLAGLSLEFSPSSPNDFFIQGSPLTLSFAPGEAGKAQGLVVKENGMVIMQATVSR